MSIDFDVFKSRFRDTSGLDLNQYKEQQMKRRILQWLTRVGAKDFDEYLRMLRADKEEVQRFLEYLTINTSQFYRDVQVFDRIKSDVLPDLMSASRRLRIWSAGCSVGAEIYTIAILLQEGYPGTKHSLLATDFDEKALAKAALGEYGATFMTTMPKNLIAKYFRVDAKGTYTVDSSLRGQVTFRRQNLLTDRYERGFDLILCRNVFIYFTNEAQERLTNEFSQSLRPGGYFIVGSAENIAEPEKYGLVRKGYCVYQRKV